jgi:hypothetical protein
MPALCFGGPGMAGLGVLDSDGGLQDAEVYSLGRPAAKRPSATCLGRNRRRERRASIASCSPICACIGRRTAMAPELEINSVNALK